MSFWAPRGGDTPGQYGDMNKKTAFKTDKNVGDKSAFQASNSSVVPNRNLISIPRVQAMDGGNNITSSGQPMKDRSKSPEIEVIGGSTLGTSKIRFQLDSEPKRGNVINDDKAPGTGAINSRDYKDFQKPSFLYSEKSVRRKEIKDVFANVAYFVEKNQEVGYFSTRQATLDWKVEDYVGHKDNGLNKPEDTLTPDYISVRVPLPEACSRDLYGQWSPPLMRLLQAKFNFQVVHLKWLQKLVSESRIPVSTRLTSGDLKVLQDEIEEAVLESLTGNILKPQWEQYKPNFKILTYIPEVKKSRRLLGETPTFQLIDYTELSAELMPNEALVFEYDNQREPIPGESQASGTRPSLKKSPAKTSLVYDYGNDKIPQKIEAKLLERASGRPMSPESAHDMADQILSDDAFRQPSPPKKARLSAPLGESLRNKPILLREEAIRKLIDKIIITAQMEEHASNPVMKLILEFPDAREIMYELAILQPLVLQELIQVMKNPRLIVPGAVIQKLREKLEAMQEKTRRAKRNAGSVESNQTVSEMDLTREKRMESAIERVRALREKICGASDSPLAATVPQPPTAMVTPPSTVSRQPIIPPPMAMMATMARMMGMATMVRGMMQARPPPPPMTGRFPSPMMPARMDFSRPPPGFR